MSDKVSGQVAHRYHEIARREKNDRSFRILESFGVNEKGRQCHECANSTETRPHRNPIVGKILFVLSEKGSYKETKRKN